MIIRNKANVYPYLDIIDLLCLLPNTGIKHRLVCLHIGISLLQPVGKLFIFVFVVTPLYNCLLEVLLLLGNVLEKTLEAFLHGPHLIPVVLLARL